MGKRQRLIGYDKNYSSILENEADAEQMMLQFALENGIVKMIAKTNGQEEVEGMDSVIKEMGEGANIESVNVNSECHDSDLKTASNDNESYIEETDVGDQEIESKNEEVENELKDIESECPEKDRKYAYSNLGNANEVTQKAQLIRLSSGQLSWALPIGKERIQGSEKNIIVFKVFPNFPVVPGQPPPTLIKPTSASGVGVKTIKLKFPSKRPVPLSPIGASASPSNPLNKKIKLCSKGQSMDIKSESLITSSISKSASNGCENNVVDMEKTESMNEEMEEGVKMESIEIKLENIEPDTFSNPVRNESQVDGHIVLFKSENHDESNLIKQI